MIFKIEANGTLEASSILDAFYKISKYYLALALGLSPELIIRSGYIEIEPLKEDK